ncbi:hypothetical protein [Candidatus Aquicultor sp.]
MKHLDANDMIDDINRDRPVATILIPRNPCYFQQGFFINTRNLSMLDDRHEQRRQ